jgi:hypothetical protein
MIKNILRSEGVNFMDEKALLFRRGRYIKYSQISSIAYADVQKRPEIATWMYDILISLPFELLPISMPLPQICNDLTEWLITGIMQNWITQSIVSYVQNYIQEQGVTLEWLHIWA